MNDSHEPAEEAGLRPTPEQKVYNRTELVKWIETAIDYDPSGWPETLAILGNMMSAVEDDVRMAPEIIDVVADWPADALPCLSMLCRYAMDAAWVRDRTVAKVAVEQNVPVVAYAVSMATLVCAKVPQAIEAYTSLLNVFTVRETMALARCTATSLSLLDMTATDTFVLQMRAIARQQPPM